MEPLSETKPQKKLTLRTVLFGIIAGLLLETLFILLAIVLGKYESEAWDLYKDKLWWFATGVLSLFLGRYVTSKSSGVQLKSIFKWEGEKDS